MRTPNHLKTPLHFILLYSLTVLLVFITSCKGQVKTNPQADKTNEVTPTQPQPKMVRTQGMLSGNVGCELQDKDGNLWFSTNGEGVYRYDGKLFTNFTRNDGLCSNDVSAIIQDKKGNIVFGTSAGICRYDGKNFSAYPGLETTNQMVITALMEDREGNLWFGTMASGVYRYDGNILTNFLNSDEMQFNMHQPYQLCLDIHQDAKGNIWFSSWNGGGVWRFDGKNFDNFLPSDIYYDANEDGRYSPRPGEVLPTYEYKEGITDDMIFSIAEDKAGNVWFGTRRHGACYYDGKTFTRVTTNTRVDANSVYNILEDRNGNIWFTTEDLGVWRYDGTNCTNFTTSDGLSNNSVFSILEDRSGNLWFGTREFGLTKYDGKSFTVFSE